MQDQGKRLAIDDVVRQMRRHISHNMLGPGAQLPSEVDLSRHLGVSRTMVREASRSLSAIGLIDVEMGKRPRVSRLKAEVLRDIVDGALMTGQVKPAEILEVRSGIEIAMASLAAQRRTPAMAKTLSGIVANMAASLHDLETYADQDLRFHEELAKAAGNAFYLFLLNGCHAAFRNSMAFGHRSRRDETELRHVQMLHERICDAVRQGDAGEAAAAMHAHFTDAINAVNRDVPAPGSGETK